MALTIKNMLGRFYSLSVPPAAQTPTENAHSVGVFYFGKEKIKWE